MLEQPQVIHMTEVKKQLSGDFIHDEEGFRMSTPQVIAEYKARRLKTRTIADIGSGVGIQALNFALISNEVMAVENDAARIEILERNARNMGLTNLEIIRGDALEPRVVESVERADTVHSDPSRKQDGVRWSFSNLSPNPMEITSHYRQDRISFDLPSLFPVELIPADWELEYVSLMGELKRLSVYARGARKFTKSAISLPDEERIVAISDIDREVEKSDIPLKWIYELDGSLYFSNLIPEFLHRCVNLKLLYQDRQKTLVTGDKQIKNSFIKRTYSVLSSVESIADLKIELHRLRAGKVILRYPMEPSLYYEGKRNMESNLDGDRTIYVFKFGGMYYTAEGRARSKLEKVK